MSELFTVNLQPASKVMLTNHNSDYLDLVSNCNTVSTTTQHSFGIFFNSIQSFGNFIKSSGCLNFTKNNIFEGFMYSKLSFSNSIPNFIILNVPNCLYLNNSDCIISFGSYFNSFMIFLNSYGIYNIIPSFVNWTASGTFISTNIALSINLRLYDVNYFSAKIKI